MAHSYEAVFEPGTRDLDSVFVGLPSLLEVQGLLYSGEVYTLERERDGTFNVTDLASLSVPLEEIGNRARRWDGVSIGLVSQELLNALGRTDAMEVDLRVCHRRGHEVSLSYREAGSAWRSRRSNQGLQRSLCRKLLAFAALIGSTRALYDEETAELGAGQIADAVGRVLETGLFPSGGTDGVLVLPADEGPSALVRLNRPTERLVSSASVAAIAINLL